MNKERLMKQESGVSLVELLVAMGITLIIVAVALGTFNDALSANEGVVLTAEMDQNLRAGANLMIHDLIQAGTGIPTGGIPIPNNGTSGTGATAVNRPAPGGAATFTNSDGTLWTSLPTVSPGAGLGPQAPFISATGGIVLGPATDLINILYADDTLPLNQYGTGVTVCDNASPPNCSASTTAISPTGDSMTVDARLPINLSSNGIRPGDLIMFTNAQGTALQQVTSVGGQTVNFAAGDAFNLNQRSASAGTIMQLQSSGTWPPTTPTRVWMITYYLDTTTNPQQPRLLQQVNLNPARAVAEVIENLQVSYDLVDGVTNPTNVKTPPAANSPNQIRKVNLYLAARSNVLFTKTRKFLRNNMATQISLRSMAFVD